MWLQNIYINSFPGFSFYFHKQRIYFPVKRGPFIKVEDICKLLDEPVFLYTIAHVLKISGYVYWKAPKGLQLNKETPQLCYQWKSVCKRWTYEQIYLDLWAFCLVKKVKKKSQWVLNHQNAKLKMCWLL